MSNSFFCLGFFSRLEYVFLKENDSFLLVFHGAQSLKKNFCILGLVFNWRNSRQSLSHSLWLA